jgi:hypothetical protein
MKQYNRDTNTAAASEWTINKTISAGEVLNPIEAHARIGWAMDRTLFSDIVIYNMIRLGQLGIELTNDLIVQPAYMNGDDTSYRNEYEVTFKGKTIFRFHPSYSEKLRLTFTFPDGLTIESEYLIDFFDDDVRYLMNNFPFYLKIIKYVMNFFLIELKNSLSFEVTENENRRYYNSIIFFEEPMNDADREMSKLLQEIHYSNTSTGFSKPRNKMIQVEEKVVNIRRKFKF